jgi:hypothetical protein
MPEPMYGNPTKAFNKAGLAAFERQIRARFEVPQRHRQNSGRVAPHANENACFAAPAGRGAPASSISIRSSV